MMSLLNYLFSCAFIQHDVIFLGEAEGHDQVLWPYGDLYAVFHSSFSWIRTKWYAPESTVNEA